MNLYGIYYSKCKIFYIMTNKVFCLPGRPWNYLHGHSFCKQRLHGLLRVFLLHLKPTCLCLIYIGIQFRPTGHNTCHIWGTLSFITRKIIITIFFYKLMIWFVLIWQDSDTLVDEAEMWLNRASHSEISDDTQGTTF